MSIPLGDQPCRRKFVILCTAILVNIISLFNNSLPDFSNLITFTSFKLHNALQGKNMKTYNKSLGGGEGGKICHSSQCLMKTAHSYDSSVFVAVTWHISSDAVLVSHGNSGTRSVV